MTEINKDIKPVKVGNIYPKCGQAGNVYDPNFIAPCLMGYGAGGGGKEIKIIVTSNKGDTKC